MSLVTKAGLQRFFTGLKDRFAPISHKHTKSQITDFPSSMPASDVSAWAKAASKPSYTKAEVGLGNVDNTADSAKSVKYATTAGSANAVAWGNVSGKPSTYPPSSHTHSYLPLSGGATTGRITAPEVAATSYFVTPTMVGEGDTSTYYHRVDWGKAGNDKVDFYEYGGIWNFYKNTAAGKDSAALVASIQADGVHANLKGKADTAGTAEFAKTSYFDVRKSVDLTKLDVNTWYPVIGDYIPYDGFHRLKCAVQLNSGTKPSWSSHSNGGFTAIVEVLQTAYGYGTTHNYGIILQNDWLWLNAGDSSVGYGQQLKNASIPVFWLRGGGVYFLYADYNCNWSIKTESYTISSQTVAPTKTYPGVYVDRSTIMANMDGNAKTATTATNANNAAQAAKLTTNAGSATQPVYFSNGVPVATIYTLGKSVPANAVFTDTNTWRGVQNNLTSDSTDQSLSAAQGKALKALVDGKAAANHTHTKAQVGLGNVDNTADSAKSVKYATSAGSAESATKANRVADYNATSKSIQIGYSGDGITGDAIKYIAGYTTGDGGDVSAKIKDISKDALKGWIGSLPANGGNSTTVNGHSVNSDVPAGAKFTDTTYGMATASSNGLMSKGDKTKLDALGDIVTIQKSLKLTTDWMDTGIAGENLSSGTYIIQVSGLTTNSTGFYQEVYSGVMTWFSSMTNSTGVDEIPLHNAGHAENGNEIYLRTARSNATGKPNTLRLQIAAKTAGTEADTITFKFRKMI